MGEGEQSRRRLTAKQERFVAEYLKDANAKQAAIRAGYSPQSAESTGPRMLRFAQVSEAIKSRQGEVLDKAEAEAADVIRELTRIGRMDPGHLVNEQGEFLPLHQLPEAVRRAISGVEVEETQQGEATVRKVKYRFWPKVEALHLLGKRHRLFADRVEHQHSISLEELIAASLPEEEEPKGPRAAPALAGVGT